MACIATKSQKFPEMLQQDIHDHNIINGKYTVACLNIIDTLLQLLVCHNNISIVLCNPCYLIVGLWLSVLCDCNDESGHINCNKIFQRTHTCSLYIFPCTHYSKRYSWNTWWSRKLRWEWLAKLCWYWHQPNKWTAE